MSPADPGPAALVATLEKFRGLTAWVVGDLMVDEYLSGSVDRISPEAPVPVVRVRNAEQRLGGAANVARQCADIGSSADHSGEIGVIRVGEGGQHELEDRRLTLGDYCGLAGAR